MYNMRQICKSNDKSYQTIFMTDSSPLPTARQARTMKIPHPAPPPREGEGGDDKTIPHVIPEFKFQNLRYPCLFGLVAF